LSRVDARSPESGSVVAVDADADRTGPVHAVTADVELIGLAGGVDDARLGSGLGRLDAVAGFVSTLGTSAQPLAASASQLITVAERRPRLTRTPL
jgi:hypothetical protein